MHNIITNVSVQMRCYQKKVFNMRVIQYLQDVAGLDVVPGKLPDDIKNGLPLYLQKNSVMEVTISGERVILDFRKSIEGSSPDQLSRQRDLLQKYYSSKVVFCFEELAAYQRNRLIQKRVSFIVPDKQMYIPSLLINLKEFGTANLVKKEKISPVSHCLLLYHIQKQSLENIPIGQIIKLIPYSAMSISRAAGELTAHGLCILEGNKTKVLRFLPDKRELWKKALPSLRSPVKKAIYLSDLPDDTISVKSNLTALDHYGNLSATGTKFIAISIAQYQEIKKRENKKQQSGELCIEVWNYDPLLFSSGEYIDVLSLYLSMMDDDDERIQIALQELLERIEW